MKCQIGVETGALRNPTQKSNAVSDIFGQFRRIDSNISALISTDLDALIWMT